jgi:hypothetical protein
MEAEGVVAWGEAPVGENPFYNEENYQKTGWTILQDYLAPPLLEADLSQRVGCDAGACPRARQPHRQSRAGVYRVGPLCSARRAQPGQPAGRHARPRGRGRQRRHPEGHSHAAQGGRRLSGRGLHAHQAQDQAGLGRRADARRARAWPNLRCRWTPTASTAWRMPRTWPNWTPSTCCWSSSRWRTTTSSTTPSSSRAQVAPLPGREHRLARACALGHRDERLRHHQHQAKPHRWAGRRQAHPRHGAGGGDAGLARRHVGDGHRARHQRGAGEPAQLHPARRHQRQRPLLCTRDIVKNPFTLNADSTLTVPTGIGHGAVVDEDFLDDVTLERWEMWATGRVTERQQDLVTGEWKHLVVGRSVREEAVAVVAKISVTEKLVIITVYRE